MMQVASLERNPHYKIQFAAPTLKFEKCSAGKGYTGVCPLKLFHERHDRV